MFRRFVANCNGNTVQTVRLLTFATILPKWTKSHVGPSQIDATKDNKKSTENVKIIKTFIVDLSYVGSEPLSNRIVFASPLDDDIHIQIGIILHFSVYQSLIFRKSCAVVVFVVVINYDCDGH